MSPTAVGIISAVLFGIFIVFIAAYCIIGNLLLFYLLAMAAVLVGPILFFIGLRMLYIRLYKLIRCKTETEGHVVDYILSPWQYVYKSSFHVGSTSYYSRWFPVVEYETDGQRFHQKYKTCILCNERPKEETMLLRYDPKHPKRFYMPDYPNEFSSPQWIATALFLFVGGLFTSASTLAIVILIALS